MPANVDLEMLSDLAVRAGHIALGRRVPGEFELKPDGSIVTDADRETELFLREELGARFPDVGFIGEEFGHEARQGSVWAIDPIDGTSNFAFGSPFWGVSIALVSPAGVSCGAIALPELDEILVAGAGKGAWLNGKQLQPIPAGAVEPFHLISYCEGIVRAYPGEKWPGKMRCMGSFVVDGAMVATKRTRAMLCIREQIYDFAAVTCVCRELGAEIRYLNGDVFEEVRYLTEPQVVDGWTICPAGSNIPAIAKQL